MIVCNRCGKENLEHYKFCLGCGGELTVRAAPPPSAPVISGAATLVDGPDDDDDDAVDPLTATAVDRPAAEALGEQTEPRGFTPARSASAPRSEASGVSSGSSKFPDTKPTIQPPPEVAAASGMKKCPTCGNQVPTEFVFCGQCGTRLADGSGKAPRTLFMTQPSAPQPQLRGKLVLIRPDGSEGGYFPLMDGDNEIGRNENPLFESDSYLSPRHAVFTLTGDDMVVRDAGSLNGVFMKMSGEEEVHDGEIFRMGQELLRFDVIHPAQPLEDGTEVMGSPNPGYWGRLSLIIGRGQDGSAFPLYGESMVVGRERGDILFPEDGYVSGTHARISHRDGRYFLADLNSSNGSFIRIHEERVIPTGSFLLMGQQLFRVQFT